MKTSRTKPAHADAELASAVYTIEAGLEALRAEMGATRDAVQLRGAEVKPLTGQTQRLTYAPTRVVGFAVLATDAVNGCTLRIRDGEGGTVLAPIVLGVNGSAREWWGPAGLATTAGLYVEVVSGSCEGAVFVGAA